MSTSIVPQLVRKDLLLWRRLILIFYGVSVGSIVLAGLLHGNLPDGALLNLGFTLLVAPAGTLGVVLLMQTNVFERAKSTQAFIMSLPVTARQFTLAKLLVNIPVFAAVWLMTTGAIFWYAFGLGLLPPGAIPMVTMICLGVFVAYSGILGVSLLSQSLGTTILAILFFEIATSAYLWMIVLLDPIGRHIFGPVAVWNGTAIAVVIAQIVAAVAAIAATLVVQTRRRDFV
jgi:hypothetical protein